MTNTVFDISLNKRFTDAPEIATIDVTSSDTLLIRDTSSGAVMRVPFSTLASAIATAFASLDGVKLGLGVTPSQLLDVNDDSIRVRTAKTPASATATGNAGQIAWDANYIYVCTAVNTWKRSQLLTW